MSGFLGKDGFAWFFGVVEDRKDPLKIGRVRVRILGYHDDDRNVLPTSELPWATPVQGITSAALGGLGSTPVGLVEGTWVLGFFTDPGSYQIPMILGSIAGLNAKTIKKLGEEPGNAFKDLRSAFQLKNAPNNAFDKREYPNGKGNDGDKHGAQLQTAESNSTYPRPDYAADASDNVDGTPDTNILGVNDQNRIDNTSVGVKNAPRENGGTRETAVPVADIPFEKFSTGVTGESGANKGTNKGLGVGYNGVDSSSKPSLKQNYKQFKDQPTNANGQSVFSSGATTVGGNRIFTPTIVSATAVCYKDSMGNIQSGASAIKQSVIDQTNKTVKQSNIQKLQSDIEERSLLGVGSYVRTANGTLVDPKDLAEQKKANQEEVTRVGTETGISTQVAPTEKVTVNGIPVTRDQFGNIILDGNVIPSIDITDKQNNQLDPNNPNRNDACGDCGCQDCK